MSQWDPVLVYNHRQYFPREQELTPCYYGLPSHITPDSVCHFSSLPHLHVYPDLDKYSEKIHN